MGEILNHNQFGSLHYGGQTPVTPSTGFFPRSPDLGVDALGFRRFSGQTSPRDRTAFDPESHRPRSPTDGDARGEMQNVSLNGSLKTASLSHPDSPSRPPRYPGQLTTSSMTPVAGSDDPPLRLVAL